jgi:hypothetical protein
MILTVAVKELSMQLPTLAANLLIQQLRVIIWAGMRMELMITITHGMMEHDSGLLRVARSSVASPLKRHVTIRAMELMLPVLLWVLVDLVSLLVLSGWLVAIWTVEWEVRKAI